MKLYCSTGSQQKTIPSGVWAILLEAGQTRANASHGRWTWQSALKIDGPTRAISYQERASFQSQNSPLENVILPAPSILNWRDMAYVHGFNKMKQNKNQLAFDSEE